MSFLNNSDIVELVPCKAYGYDDGVAYPCLAVETDATNAFPNPYFSLTILKIIFENTGYIYNVNGDVLKYKFVDDDDAEDITATAVVWKDGNTYYNLGDFCFGDICF
jgi:hypothetical protein